ncbi:MAG: methyltransferase domain-containing protein [Pseudohongiella sp.]|uniref:methyltransferase domain-containing protein n=1 Tax=Pseudohongiella sp. TaxID=1979412 RepID=UPI00349FF6A8
MTDRNFDDLASRLQRNVYQGLKGSIRQQVIQRDLQEFLPNSASGLRILDAGGGQGQMACYLAAQGHQVTLCDISGNMLTLAQAEFDRHPFRYPVTLYHGSIQDFSRQNQTPFDVITCHAVLEWVSTPQDILRHCRDQLTTNGILSVAYYNFDGLIYKNLLRKNFKKVRKEQWYGDQGSLTPTTPVQRDDFLGWINKLGLSVLCESGIRVFHDYILDPIARNSDHKEILEMELQFSRQAPFKYMGRYSHFLLSAANADQKS